MTDARKYTSFPTDAECFSYLERVRWNGKPVCPYCKASFFTPLVKGHRYHCNPCNVAFSITVGTVFHHTRIPLQKWFLAIYLITSSPKRLPVRDLASRVGINKNTALRLTIQIRQAWSEPRQREMLERIIEFTHTPKIGG